MDLNNPEIRKLRRKMIILQIVGLAFFFMGVASCYQGAIQGRLWLGPAVVAFVCVMQVLVAIRRWQKEILIILVTGLAGLILETVLLLCNVYSVEEKTRWILPAPVSVEWILALWINFGAKVSSALPGVRGKPKVVVISSAVFAVMIFHRAAKLGLITLTWGWGSTAVIAVTWAIVVPMLMRFAEKLIPPPVLPSQAAGPQK